MSQVQPASWAVAMVDKPAAAAEARAAGAEPFSEARLAALRAEGGIVQTIA